MLVSTPAYAEVWKATAYCSCVKCCQKSDGITASGIQAHVGTVACNWLPFGTQLLINGKPYTVEDRGAKSRFGDKKHHLRRLDIWMPRHKQALIYGIRKIDVQIVKQ